MLLIVSRIGWLVGQIHRTLQRLLFEPNVCMERQALLVALKGPVDCNIQCEGVCLHQPFEAGLFPCDTRVGHSAFRGGACSL